MAYMKTKKPLKWLAAGVVLLVLLATNVSIYQKEQLLTQGAVVILELAPVDPRSLMQGDYMALNYALTQPLQQGLYQQAEACRITGTPCLPPTGKLVVSVDEKQRAVSAEFDKGQPLGSQQRVMKYHLSGNTLNIGTPSYFFQEGHAERFAKARYGEFRVADDGTALLTYMLDDKGQRIFP
jgi:uncharacterized membrane-anchored protein